MYKIGTNMTAFKMRKKDSKLQIFKQLTNITSQISLSQK